MIKLRANTNLSYGGKRVKAGEPFKAHPRDAKIFVLLHKADHYVEPAPAPPPPPVVATPPPAPTRRRSPVSRAMQAAATPAAEPGAAPAPTEIQPVENPPPAEAPSPTESGAVTSGTYSRRDLRAEE
jgi:hypothetical protein